jgi:hypothetical protein
LVDVSMRLFPQSDARAAVTSLVTALGPRVASQGLGKRDMTLRDNQAYAIVDLIVYTAEGQSGAVIAPMATGKTLIALSVAIIQNLLRSGTVDAILGGAHGGCGEDRAAVALDSYRHNCIQPTIIVCPFIVLTKQYVGLTETASLKCLELKPHSRVSATENVYDVVFITPEILVRTDTILSLLLLAPITTFMGLEEFHVALQTKHWRDVFARYHHMLRYLVVARVIFSGTFPPGILPGLAELCGLSSDTALWTYRQAVIEDAGESVINVWDDLRVGVITSGRGSLPPTEYISKVATVCINQQRLVQGDNQWSSQSVALIIVHTVRCAHQLARELRAHDGVVAHAVHKQKRVSERRVAGCTADECAMSTSHGEEVAELRPLITSLLDGHSAGGSTDMCFIVASSALTGVSEERFQAVYVTALYSVCDLFQGLLRSNRVLGRPSWAFMLSTGDFAALTGSQPSAPPTALAYTGDDCELMTEPWGGELLMQMIRAAVAIYDTSDDEAGDDCVDDASEVLASIPLVTEMFFFLYQLLFEDCVHSSVSQHCHDFGLSGGMTGARSAMLVRLGKPSDYDSSSTFGGQVGDPEITAAIPPVVGLQALSERDSALLVDFYQLTTQRLCLHCGYQCMGGASASCNSQAGFICNAVVGDVGTGCKRCLDRDADHRAQQCTVIDLRVIANSGTRLCFECFSPMCTKVCDALQECSFDGDPHPCFGARTYATVMSIFKYKSDWVQRKYSITLDDSADYVQWIQQRSPESVLYNFQRVMADYNTHVLTEMSTIAIDGRAELFNRLLLRPTASVYNGPMNYVDAAIELLASNRRTDG